jgi:aspartyl-tRNA(Asn)/glutamyl-tRNA(Gln) amidotransferase subunit A
MATQPFDAAPPGVGIAELWMCRATELNALLNRNEVSPVEILASVLGRIEAANGAINAFCHVARTSAGQAALASEARCRQGRRLGPLDGIPVHVKDNLFVGGMPAAWGSLLYKDFAPAQDDLSVAALRASGAVLTGKTNTPEFALSGRTENALFGRTLNPWNTDMTPGGSSGGCAAAVAAGMGPLGLATDAGGSVRRPAGYCGVVGLKTTLGSVPRRHGFMATVHDFQTIGPIARTASDAALLFDVIKGGEIGARAESGPMRIGLALDDYTLDAAVRERVAAMGALLAEAGHEVEAVAVPWDADEIEYLWTLFSAAGAARIAGRFPEEDWVAMASPAIQSLARYGAKIPAAEYVEGLDKLQALRRHADTWFECHTCLITPTSPCTAWPADAAYPQTIGGQGAGARSASVYAAVANAAGLPALSVPVGLDARGLPIGLQILGQRGSDHGLLALGRQVESLAPATHLTMPAAAVWCVASSIRMKAPSAGRS